MRIFKLRSGLVFLLLGLLLAACGGEGNTNTPPTDNEGNITVRVGASPIPHAEILNYIRDNLAAKEGLTLDITEFNDYVQPNLALRDGQLDANFFQHVPYLEDFNAEHGTTIVATVSVHIEPLGIYSRDLTSLDAVPDNAVVTLPNDATNTGRALHLLEQAGLITLTEGVGYNATENDIVDNPKNLQISPQEAAMLPRTLEDADLAVINGNYALTSDLVPAEDALLLEEAQDNPYANVLAVPEGQENSEGIKKLEALLTSPEVKAFIEEQYQGSVIPAF